MKAHLRPCGPLIAGLTGLAALAVAAELLPAQSSYDVFVKEFGQAQKFSNDDGMQRAIASRPTDAIVHYESLMRHWMQKRAQDDRRATLDKMKLLFGKAFSQAKILDHLDRFYDRIDQTQMTLLQTNEGKKDKLYAEWEKYSQLGDRKAVLELCDQGLKLGRLFEDMGHKLNAANVYNFVAMFQDRLPNKVPNDTRDAIDTARLFMACRDAWGWTEDQYYATWKNWVKTKAITVEEEAKKAEKRRAAGLDDAAEGLSKYVDRKAKPLVSKLEFHPLKGLPKDTCFVAGEVPINWTMIKILEKPTKMDWFKGSIGASGTQDMYLVRTGGNKIAVALSDRKDEKPQAVHAGSKVKPATFYLDKKKERPYSMAFFIAGEQEPWAAATSNMAPQQDAINIFYRSTSSWVSELNGVEVIFYDDNADGVLFAEDPTAFGRKTRMLGKGPKEEVLVATYDSMQIGRRGPVVPYSGCAKIGEQWFKLAAADQGRSVEARPLHPDHFKSGTVTMKWSGARGVKPQFLVIRGRGNLQAAAFDIGSGKPVEVPEGEYEISYGRSTKGKGAQIQMVHLFRGDSELIKVTAGKDTEVKVGGPFRFDFVRGGSGDEVEIDSLLFKVIGVAGEVYCKVQGPTPAPEVVVAKTAGGRGAKPVAEYVAITSGEQLNKASATLDAVLVKESVRTMGIEVAYFPIVKGSQEGATVLKFKSPITGGLVGLRVKKHKMFGKIEPIFK